MNSNNLFSTPFLRTSRNFPEESKQLTIEINKAYVDIANSVNNRTLSIFTSIRSIQNGESWFVNKDQKQQGFRQVYPFVTANLPNIAHGINISQIYAFTKIYGTFTDGINWYPLPLVNTVNVTNQISVIVNSMNIVVTVGATAPTPVSGFVVLEWISNV